MTTACDVNDPQRDTVTSSFLGWLMSAVSTWTSTFPMNVHSTFYTHSVTVLTEVVEPGLQQGRQFLGVEPSTDIEEFLKTGALRRCVEDLERDHEPTLPLKSAWTLAYSAYCCSVEDVVKANAIPQLVRLVSSYDFGHYCFITAVFAIFSVASDSEEFGSMVRASGVIRSLSEKLSPHLGDASPTPCIKMCVGLLAVSCQKTPQRELSAIVPVLRVVRQTMSSEDPEMLQYACWVLLYFSAADTGTNEIARINWVFEKRLSLIAPLVELLGHVSDQVQDAAFLTAYFFLTHGNYEHVQQLVDHGLLPKLKALLDSPRTDIRKEAYSAVCRIMDRGFVDGLLELGIIEDLMLLLRTEDLSIQKEAAKAICNASKYCHPTKVGALANSGCMELLYQFTQVNAVACDDDLVIDALEALRRVSPGLVTGGMGD